MMFHDRYDAGRRLVCALQEYREAPGTVVLALPRGGVIIGYEISRALNLPLDVLITRKLGAPGNPELAMGALCETGYRHLNQDVVHVYGVTVSEMNDETRAQQREIDRRIAVYRGGRPLPDLAGKTVLLVDDGIATGATYMASVAALRHAGVGKVVTAVPVAPGDRAAELRRLVDEFVVLDLPDDFFGIGQFYVDFAQVTDDVVLACLRETQRINSTVGVD